MQNEKVFKTKTGYCHIFEDKIVLTRNGVIGDISKIAVGNGISRVLVIYGLLSIVFFYYGFSSFNNDRIIVGLFYTLAGIYLIYDIIKSSNNSATPIIIRNKIQNVKFNSASKGITRAYFEIVFEEKNGKLKKRLIMLPGSLSNGEIETQKAIKIMREEKLLNDC